METEQAPSRTRLLRVAAILLIIVAVVVTFGQDLRYGMIGYDTYPMIIASRIQSFGDLAGTFGEPLMGGRYSGEFYRPLVNLTFALDHAMYGLRPAGYHLTNLALMAGCALALYALMVRLTGGSARVAPVVAALVFVLHPSQFEVVPVPPRRAEMMCWIFMAMCLVVQLSPRALALRRPALWPAVLALLAYLSKEIGFILPVLVFLAVTLYTPRRGALSRLAHGCVASAGPLAALLVTLSVRWALLKGIGGHVEKTLFVFIKTAASSVYELTQVLIFPQALMLQSALASWLFCGILLSLALTAGSYFRYRRRGGMQDRGLVKGAVLGFFLLLLPMVVYGTAGRLEPWYLLLPVGGYAMLVGMAAQGLIRRGPFIQRAGGTLSVLLLSLLVIWQVWYSPLVHHYDEYERISVAGDRFLDELEKQIDGAGTGSIIQASPLPRYIRLRPDRANIIGARALEIYSVQAWVELVYPDRRIRVVPGPPQGDGPLEDEIVVHVTKELINF